VEDGHEHRGQRKTRLTRYPDFRPESTSRG
jgi:hypothetical protein